MWTQSKSTKHQISILTSPSRYWKNNFKKSKTSTTQHPTSPLKVNKQGNKMLSISKWTRRWENSKHLKYKNIVPSITHKKLTLRAILLKNTSRKGISKIAKLKTGDSMLKGHKIKIDKERLTFCFKLQRIQNKQN